MEIAIQFAQFRQELVGFPISHVWRGHGSAVFLEIGSLSDTGFRDDGSKREPKGEIGLMVEWSWRVQSQEKILFGSWSDERLWEKGFKSLRGQFIADCQLFGTIPEVTIRTDNDLEFISFSTTDGQPEWAFFDRRTEVPTTYCVEKGKLMIE